MDPPIDITAVAIIANDILFVALTIDCSSGHESDMNAYGVKKVKIFTAEDSGNVLEKLLEIVPAESSSILLPAVIPSSVVRDTTVDMDLDLEFRETEVKVPRVRSKQKVQSSEGESDDDEGSDSTGDSERDQDLALYLEEVENLSRTPNSNGNRGVAYKSSRLDFKTTTHSQGTNTSLFNIGFQSKSTLSNRDGTNCIESTSRLPDSSSRRIRMFDLQEVRSVVSSSDSLVLQRGQDAVAFTGTLQSAITVQVTKSHVLFLSIYFSHLVCQNLQYSMCDF